MTLSGEVRRESSMPLHRRIRNILRANIRSDLLKPGMSKNMVALGKASAHRTLTVAETVPTPEVAERLEFDDGDPVLTIERLLLADDVPTSVRWPCRRLA